MRLVLVAAACATISLSQAAQAGEASNNLTRCVSAKVTSEDRTNLTRWLFAGFARNPAVAAMASIPPVDREKISLAIARFYDRMMLVECRKEAVDALKNDGAMALLQVSMELGSTAGRDLATSTEVDAEIGEYAKRIDREGWAKLTAEAGVEIDMPAED